MRPSIVRILTAAAIALVWFSGGGPSFAGLDNTHHDIRYYLPDKDACLVCHGRRDNNFYGTLERELGTVGGQCIFLCHSGKGILPETDTLVPEAGPSVSTEDYTTRRSPDYTAVFFTRSHGRQPGNLKDATGKPVTWPPAGLTWQGFAGGTQLECTTCHSVHDGRYAPFLLSPLAAEYPKMDGFCDRCHLERATGNLTGPPDGSHPVDFLLDNQAASIRGDLRRRPRRIVVQRYGRKDAAGDVNVFDVPAPSPAALTPGGASWSMGGHLSSKPGEPMTPWTGPGSRQQMGCYTCHSAHRTAENGERNLVVVRTVDARNRWNPLCVGCHGASVTLEGDKAEWDVGTTGYGHPGGARTSRDPDGTYTSSVAGFRFRIATPAHVSPQNGNRFGENGELLCTTCHKVHFGVPGTMAIANLGQGTRAVCKSCHDGSGNPLPADGVQPPNSHHVTVTKERWGEFVAGGRGFENPSWANTTSGLGDFSTGMDCADCHTSNGTAHNW